MGRLEYKYSRLVMSANKECELPAADSCALAEGEEPEDDVVYTQKPSLLRKLRAIANKVGFLPAASPAAFQRTPGSHAGAFD